MEYLSKPVLDDEGNLTELGKPITNDKAMDLDTWVSDKLGLGILKTKPHFNCSSSTNPE